MNSQEFTWFEVDDCNTIRYADFEAPETRSDTYEIYPGNPETPEELVEAAESCVPLQGLIAEHYTNYREDPGHPDRLLTLPEEPDDGWRDWVLALDTQIFTQLMDSVLAWFQEEPDWMYEEDYIPDLATAQGAALAYFNDERELCQQLGIKIVEGEYPGSSYYAAELRGTVEAANAAAESAGLAIRFRREA